MKYSIIIITKDNREKLLRALESINKNLKTFKDFEIIVVEAGENLTDLAYTVKHIKLSLKDAGFSNQRNIGVNTALGEWVIFIDDDVEITDKWFFEITKKLPQDKFGAMGAVFPKEGANLISFSLGVLGHPGGGFRLDNYSKGEDMSLSQVATCNTVFRKDIIKDVGMFNIKNKFGSEDSDLCLRIIKKYGENRFLFLPKALVWHDTHKNIYKALRWYIRRGRADIDLIFIEKLHIDYVLKTSILIKFFVLLIIGFFGGFKFFAVGFLVWYFYQIYKYFFMVKYFKFYDFGFIYRLGIIILFPLIKFLADLFLDIGRIVQTCYFLINKK
ncbi:MAG: glycosyltransferase family 2 protein [Elusimicrobiales bacterium]|nr:glycosyltransferase [Elusimicrobiales bacterium]HOL62353.1 glycosyltransferase [Elusimicrobiales bacterium]HPO94474.1 glycosyltransferase [Elusimicrobiales bacterium]